MGPSMIGFYIFAVSLGFITGYLSGRVFSKIGIKIDISFLKEQEEGEDEDESDS